MQFTKIKVNFPQAQMVIANFDITTRNSERKDT